MIAKVIVDIAQAQVDRVFDYNCDENLCVVGSRVWVPFGNRQIEGYIVELSSDSKLDSSKIKSIVSVIDKSIILPEMIDMMYFMKEKYHLRLIDTLRLFLPAALRNGKIKELKQNFVNINSDYTSSDENLLFPKTATSKKAIFQFLRENGTTSATYINFNFSSAALRNMILAGIVSITEVIKQRSPYNGMTEQENNNFAMTANQKAAISSITNCADTYLLHGITGSGKTEVYMHSIQNQILCGKTAIMLVPEISLTPQILRHFRSRFGKSVAILHSGLSDGERFDEWFRLFNGEAVVAIGARSAIFAPLSNLGLIIIDEEHDSSYISESNPRYNTIEIAQFRSKFNNCSLVLGSATPSIDSYHNAKIGEYKLLELPLRVNNKPLPNINVVNMCDEVLNGNNGAFSAELKLALSKCISDGNQAIIFLNRRGYSSYIMCRGCGYVAKCTDCDVSLVYHKEENILKCHYCDNRFAVINTCPQCKSPHIKQGVLGTQKIVSELNQLFPNVGILRMDNDTTKGKDAHLNILQDFGEGKAQILVGTQMVAKGHDFPNVTLVGIVDADMSLHFSDFRSSERTYQLITQVAGRAGRESKQGYVILQTYSPRHYVYKFAVNNNYKGFFEKECNLREVTKYPPFSTIVRILLSSEVEESVCQSAKVIYSQIKQLAVDYEGSFAYLGVMKAPIKRIQNKFRYQILSRISLVNVDEIISKIYAIVDNAFNAKTMVFVEINPNNLS